MAPRLVVDIYEKFMAGDYAGAVDAQYKLIPLRNAYNYGSFPVVMKECLNLIVIEVGSPVRPIEHCTEEKQEMIKDVLKSLDLI